MNIIAEELKKRLSVFDIIAKEDTQDELREITQELILLGLSKAGIFNKASFHGGTALRLLYKTKRYSEDLDFVLDETDQSFTWKPYLDKVIEFVNEYGCKFEMSDKSKAENTVKKAFIKDSSIEQMMNFSWSIKGGTPEKVNIKLEIDSNPPLYSESEIKKYNFPCEYEIKIHKLSSLFAGKCHALLCREYNKGRDWFDFKWYVENRVEPNYKYLKAMLEQQGQYKNGLIEVNKIWLCDKLKERIENIEKNDLEEINKDIKMFTKNNPDSILSKQIMLNLVSNI
ncbi:MAG: nucleotidyl transferase AbiEii/AbiGii toxin family protein [Treponema sp.]|nr:nucleotidyl transferase AbiEii/AbiGii toxin family protein [Treponema sp.]